MKHNFMLTITSVLSILFMTLHLTSDTVRNVVAVGGELSARVGWLPAIRLGGFVVSMPFTQFSQNTSGILATPDLAGIIGAQMLRRFTVILDYRRREMILEPNEHFGDSSE